MDAEIGLTGAGIERCLNASCTIVMFLRLDYSVLPICDDFLRLKSVTVVLERSKLYPEV